METQNHFEVRTMSRNELDFAVGLATKEGWNPGLHDADCFYATDPEGFLIGLLNGQPIGCISAVSYGGQFGFAGFYIVMPEHRGKGFGIQLWHAAMKRLAGQLIGLDGVMAQQDNYCKSGFQLAYRNIRYSGNRWPAVSLSHDFVPLSSIPLSDLVAYDHRFFPVRRERFLAAWQQQPEASAFASITQGKLTGYGVIRPCQHGYKIGPLFADSADIARRLLLQLVHSVPAGEDIYFDVPEANPDAVKLAEEFGLQKVFETARMYTGPAPAMDLRGIFGVTTFELG